MWKQKVFRASDLTAGKVLSCGCLRNERVREAIGNKLVGQKFGLLTVIEQADSIREESGTIRTAWKCKCDCGNEVIVKTRDLIAGDTHSCGCLTQSYGAQQIEDILIKNDINFKKEYSFNDLRTEAGYLLFFDFAIFNKKDKLVYLIECQGKQHFEPVKFFGGEKRFLIQQDRDNLKRNYCFKNNIPLIEVDYFSKRNIDKKEIIKEELLC